MENKNSPKGLVIHQPSWLMNDPNSIITKTYITIKPVDK